MKLRASVVSVVAVSVALAWGCSPSEERLGVEIARQPPPVPFAPEEADAGPATATPEATAYCPSNKCADNWATCPTSRFPCDINLLVDKENCGECGHACPLIPGRGNATFECVEGQCVMACKSPPGNIDCDGLPDNGCETVSTTNENCGGCGIKCPDPAKPCLDHKGKFECGCPSGFLLCMDNLGKPNCIDPDTDDSNCGRCSNSCSADGDGADPPPSNTYYGCVNGRCKPPGVDENAYPPKPGGNLKCREYFMNCDGNISNGCEASVYSRDNCGSCGNACPGDQDCRGDMATTPTCSCADDEVYCPYWYEPLPGHRDPVYIRGKCTTLTADTDNCGACHHTCHKSNTGSSTTAVACTFGMCSTQCIEGRADCNGNPLDGCEVDTHHDPQNCGGCGIVCDAVAGQACVGGHCSEEPCNPEEPGGFTQ